MEKKAQLGCFFFWCQSGTSEIIHEQATSKRDEVLHTRTIAKQLSEFMQKNQSVHDEMYGFVVECLENMKPVSDDVLMALVFCEQNGWHQFENGETDEKKSEVGPQRRVIAMTERICTAVDACLSASKHSREWAWFSLFLLNSAVWYEYERDGDSNGDSVSLFQNILLSKCSSKQHDEGVALAREVLACYRNERDAFDDITKNEYIAGVVQGSGEEMNLVKTKYQMERYTRQVC